MSIVVIRLFIWLAKLILLKFQVTWKKSFRLPIGNGIKFVCFPILGNLKGTLSWCILVDCLKCEIFNLPWSFLIQNIVDWQPCSLEFKLLPGFFHFFLHWELNSVYWGSMLHAEVAVLNWNCRQYTVHHQIYLLTTLGLLTIILITIFPVNILIQKTRKLWYLLQILQQFLHQKQIPIPPFHHPLQNFQKFPSLFWAHLTRTVGTIQHLAAELEQSQSPDAYS